MAGIPTLRSAIINRYNLILVLITSFLVTSFLIRLLLFAWQGNEVCWSPMPFLRTLATGAFFDIGTLSFITLPGVVYLSLFPKRFIGSVTDKVIVCIFFSLAMLLLLFIFFAEVTFWEEFRARFNFIAVDYLIYTYEVVSNINESYPLPFLLSGVVAVTALLLFILYKRKAFARTFAYKPAFRHRLGILGACVSIAIFFHLFVPNDAADWSDNRYNNEISKSGIYSFFAAFRNNRIRYSEFYTCVADSEAFGTVRAMLSGSKVRFVSPVKTPIQRDLLDTGMATQPNVVLILMESMSAGFMKEFGNRDAITPTLDTIALESVFFTNLYATGTRTVRGMEALTLCIPPTPGQSIVKRPGNDNLFTIGSIFRLRGYNTNFFYGGDGYFDNMNSFFGGNGFSIYDRGRGSILSDNITSCRYPITDEDVTFENAWGVCDEDIYDKMIEVADTHYKRRKPFFNFVMTTSNHKPYTYPAGKIDIPSGTGREGAVKYADFAIGKMLREAAKKPWFKNTVFVIVADHCASSAGKDEIDVANYHIPAIIYNLPGKKFRISRQCSQIDVFPTLFSMLHWSYRSNFFGADVLADGFKERALVGTYIKLGLLRKDRIMILSDRKKQAFYRWDKAGNSLARLPMQEPFLRETVSWYQTADYMFSNKMLKE